MKRKIKTESNAGIWLDERRAYIIILQSSGKPSIESINSDVELMERFAGEKRPYAQFGTTYDNFEAKKQRRQKQERDRYFKKLISRVQGANYIYVFGPGKAKEELNNKIKKDHTFQNKLIIIGTTGRLTQNQMVQQLIAFYQSDEFLNRKNELSQTAGEINS